MLRVVAKIIDDQQHCIELKVWQKTQGMNKFRRLKLSPFADKVRANKVTNCAVEVSTRGLLYTYPTKTKAIVLTDGNPSNMLEVTTDNNYIKGSPYQIVGIQKGKYIVVDGLREKVMKLTKEETIKLGSGDLKYLNASIVQGRSIRGIKQPIPIIETSKKS